MISVGWLFLIVPITFAIGFSFSGILSSNKLDDKCSQCQYRKYKEDKEKSV